MKKVHLVFTACRLYKNTATQLNEALVTYIQSPLNVKYPCGKSKFSNYLKGYVQGVIETERENIMQNEVEFCYLVDDVLYSTHKETSKRSIEELYKANKEHLLSNAPHNFYWKSSNKPYTTLE